MSEMTAIPTKDLRNLINDIAFLKQVIVPLVKGAKASEYMTADEACEALQIGKVRMRELRASGQIRYRKPAYGRNTEYLRKDIEAYKNGDILIPKKKKTAALTTA